MALWDFVKKQFIDIIQWTEDEEGTLAYRYPMRDMEIQYGASLTVRDSQLAVFVDEGRVADVFQPGRFKLTTQTIPVLTYLRNWDKLFESPFKSDVYFFSTRLQVNQKWGTPNPITIRDKEFGAVRLRAFGIYTYRIVDPKSFYLNVSGTRERYMVDDLSGQLRNTIVGSMTDLFAESGIPFLDLAANQDELAARLRAKLADNFKALGLELSGFVVENVSLPEELQKILDQRIGMNMVGDMARYTQFQVASSIPTAAANEGGVAGAGAGLGAGVAMGQAMARSLGQTMQTGGDAAGATKESAQDVMQLLEKLHDLKTKGILSEEEFSSKKADLLKKLG
ncbi:MAG: SPFH domain-containing protein [Betaproteobacteria bacterium]|jgi:membrane protease subunit (stomatin/prohibitin family)|nr:SPFH domain-containing protein [Betaproteobacteria bacterium]